MVILGQGGGRQKGEQGGSWGPSDALFPDLGVRDKDVFICEHSLNSSLQYGHSVSMLHFRKTYTKN